MSALWPPQEPAQIEYERLRERMLYDQEPEPDLLQCFERLGLAGLILRPSLNGVWSARVSGARRPPWTPHQDPRLQVLRDAFSFLLVSPRPADGSSEALA